MNGRTGSCFVDAGRCRTEVTKPTSHLMTKPVCYAVCTLAKVITVASNYAFLCIFSATAKLLVKLRLKSWNSWQKLSFHKIFLCTPMQSTGSSPPTAANVIRCRLRGIYPGRWPRKLPVSISLRSQLTTFSVPR